MNSNITFEYTFSDEDDFGWLAARVDTPQFSGRNGMWVQWQDINDFAALLSRFPIEEVHPVIGEWGLGEGKDYTEIIKLSIAPSGSTGGLVAKVVLVDYYNMTDRCTTHFETDYPALSVFREQIERMMQDRNGIALLAGFR